MQTIHLSFPLGATANMPEAQAVAIGDFDGVHLGHQDVIRRALSIARQEGIASAIMTFDPHPREVLGLAGYSRYLAPLPERLERFAAMGVDRTYIVHFDEAFAKVSPERFVEEMLLPLRIHAVIVGFDFTFGHKGKGTVDTLRELGRDRMRVEVVEPYHMEGDKVSSTLIRESLHMGNLARAERFLGRYYAIRGKVVHGEGRGTTIGVPTANVEVAMPYVIPTSGVYAVRAHVNGELHPGVMNIGVKPTFGGTGPDVLEVHLLDFRGDLYGEELEVEFVRYLRGEVRFGSVEELVAQIRRDIGTARTVLSEISGI
ncbi:riboflavin biosynthesis protein [Xylanibacillus composti]|uniref:Riboflavin biosynthesis protein n=1 Tax=Xylanibacillus composti TaxID=1572762 RepID=A0A8J4M179_9BACL|nr:bifunctional riboflavin kinase/FAD synthetase [Xylanibacillus composti]GIQ68595.1 riboflavin biosynthesis protein [Xylanibacillus composti]